MKRRKINTCILLVISSFFHSRPVIAQDLIGYNFNNYSGINSVTQNPASIASSRYKFHLNLITANINTGNNAYEFDRKKIFGLNFTDLDDKKDYHKILNGRKRNAWANTEILGPSFLLNLNNSSAIAISTRLRALVNAYNLSNQAFLTLTNKDVGLYNVTVDERNVKLNTSAFADISLTYARVLKISADHLVKGGLSLKYIRGISAGSVAIQDLNINIKDFQSLEKLQGTGMVVYDQNLDKASSVTTKSFTGNDRPSTFAFDLGFVWEKRSGKFKERPEYYRSKFRTIPYDLRFSLAVTDIAFSHLKYKPGSESASYGLSADQVKKDTFNVRNAQDIESYLQTLQLSNLLTKNASSQSFSTPLPSSLRINADWHFLRKLFLNADILMSFRGASSTRQSVNYISTFSLTPRFESQWLSFATPLSYNVQKEFNWGASIRSGPFFLGSGSILSNLLKNNIQNLDAYAGLSIPIYQGKRPKKQPKTKPSDTTTKKEIKASDRDQDGIPDNFDECPDLAGDSTLKGCPDKDSDGVADRLDNCPDKPGLSKYNGCPPPDSDGDGLNDEEDQCPHEAGTALNYGCPERKEDIIQEEKQKLDFISGALYFASGKAKLHQKSLKALDQLIELLKSDENIHLLIEGHTDARGSKVFNLSLSRKRAESAKAYLIKKGISKTRISTNCYGSSLPIADNKTATGRAANRRIVIIPIK